MFRCLSVQNSLSISLVMLTLWAQPANCNVITAETGGTLSSRFHFFWGQSFTTPAGIPWQDVLFSFEDVSGTPQAVGTGYLFASRYQGTVNGLARAVFLARSDPASANEYRFLPAFRLAPGTTYYFYSDGFMRLLGGGNHNVGGSAYFAANGADTFAPTGGGNTNFSVSGTPVPPGVPEPESWLLTMFGLGLVGGIIRRKACRLPAAGLPA